MLPEIEVRVARLFRVPLEHVRDAERQLSVPRVDGAKLRRVRTVSRDRLGPAIYAGLQIAAAVVRNLRDAARAVAAPDADPLAWRGTVPRNRGLIDLKAIVGDLWVRGIPVVHVEVLPSPCYQGMACIAGGRPVVLVGHGYDDPGRLSHFVGHEAGHVANGDCAPDQPVVDDQNEIPDEDPIEQRADAYARRLLIGEAQPVAGNNWDFRRLASACSVEAKKHGVDPAALVWEWASRSREYAMATLAARALYRDSGGKRLLRAAFDENVDIETASDTDRALLRCVYGDPERDETVA